MTACLAQMLARPDHGAGFFAFEWNRQWHRRPTVPVSADPQADRPDPNEWNDPKSPHRRPLGSVPARSPPPSVPLVCLLPR